MTHAPVPAPRRQPHDGPPVPDLATGPQWVAQAQAAVRADPGAIDRLFALAGRRVGRTPLRPAADPRGIVHGTLDDAARAALVVTFAEMVDDGPELAERLTVLYRRGDTAERRGVLRGLDALTVGAGPGPAAVAAGVELAADALRTNDQSLVAAAVGAFAARYLDQHSWRHAVLKLVFLGISLDAVAGLTGRADDELARMARDYAAERRAAARPVPADLARLTPDVPQPGAPPTTAPAGTSSAREI